MPHYDDVRHEIVRHMALAFFASAWADYSEQVGPHYPAGCQIFDAMPGAFNADKAAGMKAVYQWDITGDGGGKWNAAIADGAITVSEGENDSPNITITVAAQDWLDITNGKLDGQMAFMSGKLKVKGDMSLAMKMKTLFG